MIRLTPHAAEKLRRLRELNVTEPKIVSILLSPLRVLEGYHGRSAAIGPINEDLELVVVYEERNNTLLIITVYPARRGRYP